MNKTTTEKKQRSKEIKVDRRLIQSEGKKAINNWFIGQSDCARAASQFIKVWQCCASLFLLFIINGQIFLHVKYRYLAINAHFIFHYLQLTKLNHHR